MDSGRMMHRGLRVEFSVVQGSRGPKTYRVLHQYTAKEARWARLYTSAT
jgi:hypothetical protein